MSRELKRALRRDCAALLLAALLLRGAASGSSLFFTKPAVRQEAATLTLRFRDVPEETAPAQNSAPAETDLPAADTTPVFTAADAALVSVAGNCTRSYDAEALLTGTEEAFADTTEPQLLIVHTHGTESYTPADGEDYERLTEWSTLDAGHSVIRVGEAIRERLAERGIVAVHDETLCDYPVYRGAYDRMEAVIADDLARYPSIRMVLDVHRDAFDDPDGSAGTTARDGVARIMLVVGTDEGGLYHPDWQPHLGLAMQLQVLLERTSPGITRPISLCRQRYNQHMTPCSLLAEFGANGDSLEEALRAAELFADALAALLLPA